jgi:hypothetical protein
VRALSRARKRRKGGITGGLLWPLVADPRADCSLGGLVEVAQLRQLTFELSDPGRRPIPLHALAECQGSVLFQMDGAGAASRWERRGGALSTSARVAAPSRAPFFHLFSRRGSTVHPGGTNNRRK